jgi:hypothetical protein
VLARRPGGNSRLVVIRLLAEGRLDRSFGRGGVARPKLPKGFLTTGVPVQEDGQIVVSGSYNDCYSLVRLISNGGRPRLLS